MGGGRGRGGRGGNDPALLLNFFTKRGSNEGMGGWAA